jgi:hypothetical protein
MSQNICNNVMGLSSLIGSVGFLGFLHKIPYKPRIFFCQGGNPYPKLTLELVLAAGAEGIIEYSLNKVVQ